VNADRDAAILTYVENAVLNEGEKIVWRGRPSPGACARIDLSRTIFGVIFIIVGGAWTLLVINAHVLMTIPGVVGLFYGVRLSIHTLTYYLKAGHTYYAVTNRRILIITAGRSISVDSVTGVEIKELRRLEKQDGTGTVTFRYKVTVGEDQYGVRKFRSVGFKDGLWGVSDVAGAARAIAVLQPAVEDVKPNAPKE